MRGGRPAVVDDERDVGKLPDRPVPLADVDVMHAQGPACRRRGWRQVHPLLYAATAMFAAYFAWGKA